MAVRLDKPFFFTTGCRNMTQIAWFGGKEISSAMSKEWTLGLRLQPPYLES